MNTTLEDSPMFEGITKLPALQIPVTPSTEEGAVEGFLDLIKGVFKSGPAKKSDPASWKRGWLSTKALIKVIQTTYGNHEWLNHRGTIPAETVNMSDMASVLVVNHQAPNELAVCLDQHLHTTQTLLHHWASVSQARNDTIIHALRQIGFNPDNVRLWPFYSNQLTMLLRNLKPLNLLAAYHEFEGLMGTIVVMSDGQLTIGKQIIRPVTFPKLSLDEIPAVAQALVNLLTYTLEEPPRVGIPSVLTQRVVVGISQPSDGTEPRKIYASFLTYLHEHNQMLGHLLNADYVAHDEYGEEEHDEEGVGRWLTSRDYSDAYQPYDQVIVAVRRLCLAAEYWMYRSVK